MKAIPLLLAVALCAVGCQKLSNESSSSSANNSTSSADSTSGYPKRYLVESGIIEYELTGPQKGTETVYFDKWGWREAKYTNSELSIAGITRKESKLSFMDGDWIVNVDLERRTGTKIKNSLLPQFIEAAKKKGQTMTELGEEMLSNMGGQKVGTDQIAGKTCDVWETKSLGSRSCVWHGVTLMTQTNMAGMQITSTATRFEENASIPADKFVIPGDVRITEGADPKSVLEGIRKKTKGR
jgi:hypothetical protein